MTIQPKYLIAGGVAAALGLGGYVMLKGKDKPEDKPADKAEGAATDEATQAPADQADPNAAAAADPAAGEASTPQSAPGATPEGAAAETGQAREVGPYTVVADKAGNQIVFQTATKQPVGVLDEQGNIHPITVDANGKMSLAPEGAANPNAGTGPAPGADTGAVSNAATGAAMLNTPYGPVSQGAMSAIVSQAVTDVQAATTSAVMVPVATAASPTPTPQYASAPTPQYAPVPTPQYAPAAT